MWGRQFVPVKYNEQLEEELFLFAKTRGENIAQCYIRMRRLTRMIVNLPAGAIDHTEEMLIRYFERAMPSDWKIAYERSGIDLLPITDAVRYFERLQVSEKSQQKESGRHTHATNDRSQDPKTKHGGNKNKGRLSNR